MNGIERITAAFQTAKNNGRAALVPYFTAGYPTLEASIQIVSAIASSGADLIELGVPFSDPLADGPTIQHSAQAALQEGMTLRKTLEMVRGLRRSGVTQPIILMGYANPFLAYGLAAFTKDAREAGVDGVIVPDLPYDEGGELEALCRAEGLAVVYMLAPTSSPERICGACARTSGFLYLVSLTGVTGARTGLPADLADFVGRVRVSARTPVAVGFGISTPEQARAVGKIADGVIVGSAVINAASGADDPARAAGLLVQSLRGALEGA